MKGGALTFGLFLSVVAISAAQTGLTEADKEELLRAHNDFRGMVNPTATNMLRMVWNDELAAVAQTYAEVCTFEHNPNRGSQAPSFSSVGENLFATTGQTVSYTSYVQSWYNEVQDYDYSDNSCSAVCGHYTQVVWADSHQVGCGVRRCATIQGIDNFNNALLLVCNYGPAGNFVGQSPYESGQTCSNCPQDRPHCVDNLCSAEPPEETCSNCPEERPHCVENVCSADPAEESCSNCPAERPFCVNNACSADSGSLVETAVPSLTMMTIIALATVMATYF